MKHIKTLGIDLAKSSFQLHGVDDSGKRVLKRKLNRSKLAQFIANLEPCLIGMEACGGAHHWARLFRDMGHDVRLIAAQFVKPYVKSNKNDAHDAEAICEAVSRPHMRFVPIKEVEHQDMQMLHRMRSQAVKQRTALSNQIRGLLLEYGIALNQGFKQIRERIPDILEDATNGLSTDAREYFAELKEEFNHLDKRVGKYDAKILKLAKEKEICRRLLKIEGIGPLTATIMWSTITEPKLFKNGRGVSAMLGLVPRQNSSGHKTRLQGISRRGDRYVRTLLIHGGRTVVKAARARKTERQKWIADRLDRLGFNRTAVAVANKNARIIWAVMSSGESYQPNRLTGAAA